MAIRFIFMSVVCLCGPNRAREVPACMMDGRSCADDLLLSYTFVTSCTWNWVAAVVSLFYGQYYSLMILSVRQWNLMFASVIVWRVINLVVHRVSSKRHRELIRCQQWFKRNLKAFLPSDADTMLYEVNDTISTVFWVQFITGVKKVQKVTLILLCQQN